MSTGPDLDAPGVVWDVHAHYLPESAISLMGRGQVQVTTDTVNGIPESITVNGIAVGATVQQLSDIESIVATTDREGLDRTPLLAASGRTGAGVAELRGELVHRVAARRAATDRLSADVREQTRDRVALRRFAAPAEIATVVVRLLGDEFAFMTGSVVTIDGGYLLGA